MDYVKPAEVVKTMLASGESKSALPVKDLLLRGILSGALLGFATSLAITAATQTGVPLVGALIFPVGFVMIVLLGLELVTGSFAVVVLAGVNGRQQWPTVLSNLFWVYVGNLIGSVLYGVLLYAALTSCGTDEPSGIALKITAAAEAKTHAYAAHGFAGMMTAVAKGILCNWMVCLGVVMAMTSQSTVGKIIAMWLPILTFFAQGFEHAVVNMFVIPTGIMFGAKVSLADWWIWNQIPVTVGNLIGGLLFVGLFLYWTYKPAEEKSEAVAAAPAPVAEGLAQA
jgi:formate transporter